VRLSSIRGREATHRASRGRRQLTEASCQREGWKNWDGGGVLRRGGGSGGRWGPASCGEGEEAQAQVYLEKKAARGGGGARGSAHCGVGCNGGGGRSSGDRAAPRGELQHKWGEGGEGRRPASEKNAAARRCGEGCGVTALLVEEWKHGRAERRWLARTATVQLSRTSVGAHGFGPATSGAGFRQGSRSERAFMARRAALWQPGGGWRGAWHQVETGFRRVGPDAGRRPTSGTSRQKNPELKTPPKQK
jgi:hypothetical protein